MIRVVVTGGRGYADKARVFAELQALARVPGVEAIAHGACRCYEPADYPQRLSGADRWADQWAWRSAVSVTPYFANLRRAKREGPVRNRRMLDDFKPDIVLAFPGGKGTSDCIAAARERGIRVVEVTP